MSHSHQTEVALDGVLARRTVSVMRTALEQVLKDNEFNTGLFLRLLRSFPLRLQMIRESGGKPIKYHG